MNKMMKIKEMANMPAIRKAIKNSLTEDGAELASALRQLLDEIESAEIEVDATELEAKILEIVNANKEVPEAIATEIQNAVKGVLGKVQNAVNNGRKSDSLSAKVKNDVCSAILRAKNREDVKSSVNAVLVQNGITGYEFGDIVDYTIVDAWGTLNPIFAQLHKTYYTKFFYTEQELATAAILAKQWDKTGDAEKAIQALEVEGKQITTKYIYKRQSVSQEDLDEIEKAGETSNFVKWINEELDRQIVNTIIIAMLKGDALNAAGSKITTFETIGTKTASDIFTTNINPESDTVKLTDLRRLADAVKNPDGKKKIVIMSTALLSQVSEFTYAAGGSTEYRGKDEVAAMIGVDEVITVDILDPNDGLYAIAMLPGGYWYNEKNALDVVYPQYEKNSANYQKERNIGGAIHDLYSTAVLKAAN